MRLLLLLLFSLGSARFGEVVDVFSQALRGFFSSFLEGFWRPGGKKNVAKTSKTVGKQQKRNRR